MLLQSIFHKPMYKTTNGWFFKQIPQRYLGSRSPNQKPALICVTRSGTFRVLFQGQDSRWQEFKSETENVASPSELLTHAAMCAEGVVEKDNPEKGRQYGPVSKPIDITYQKAPSSSQCIIATENFGFTESDLILRNPGSPCSISRFSTTVFLSTRSSTEGTWRSMTPYHRTRSFHTFNSYRQGPELITKNGCILLFLPHFHCSPTIFRVRPLKGDNSQYSADGSCNIQHPSCTRVLKPCLLRKGMLRRL